MLSASAVNPSNFAHFGGEAHTQGDSFGKNGVPKRTLFEPIHGEWGEEADGLRTLGRTSESRPRVSPC